MNALNQEPYYGVVCWGLRFGFVGIMALTWLICHYRFSNRVKVISTLAAGYITGVVGIWLYWSFAGNYAPTVEIANEIYSKDGAPQLFVPFIMPLFISFFYLILLPALNAITRLFPR